MCETCDRLLEEQAMEKPLTGADITEEVEDLVRRFNDTPGVESWVTSEGNNGSQGGLMYTFSLNVRVEPQPKPAPEAPNRELVYCNTEHVTAEVLSALLQEKIAEGWALQSWQPHTAAGRAGIPETRYRAVWSRRPLQSR
jgi:hypothetical protein